MRVRVARYDNRVVKEATIAMTNTAKSEDIFTSYITKAGDDYTYFSLGNDWDSIKVKYGFTDNDMFKLINESFGDDGINTGKTFLFSHNPINDRGSLGMEYEYLLKNNYIWDDITMTMRPR